MQNSKGGGLAAGFTGSQIMGVRKTADFLEKATWTLAGALILMCIITNLILPGQEEGYSKISTTGSGRYAKCDQSKYSTKSSYSCS